MHHLQPVAGARVVLRTLEALQAFPRLFLLLGLAAIVRPGVLSVVLILGLTGWIPMARLVRGEFMSMPASCISSSGLRVPPALSTCSQRWTAGCPSFWTSRDIAGDANHNAACAVEFRRKGDAAWRRALPLFRVDYAWYYAKDKATKPANSFAGSIGNSRP